MQHSYMRGVLLLALALILGFALMGFEMLGSRYLYPYFGGGNVVAVGYDGPQLSQAELLARAAKAQERHKLRYDLTELAAERRVLNRPTGKILTDDFAPVETMRAIEQRNEKWKEQTEAPR